MRKPGISRCPGTTTRFVHCCVIRCCFASFCPGRIISIIVPLPIIAAMQDRAASCKHDARLYLTCRTRTISAASSPSSPLCRRRACSLYHIPLAHRSDALAGSYRSQPLHLSHAEVAAYGLPKLSLQLPGRSGRSLLPSGRAHCFPNGRSNACCLRAFTR